MLCAGRVPVSHMHVSNACAICHVSHDENRDNTTRFSLQHMHVPHPRVVHLDVDPPPEHSSTRQISGVYASATSLAACPAAHDTREVHRCTCRLCMQGHTLRIPPPTPPRPAACGAPTHTSRGYTYSDTTRRGHRWRRGLRALRMAVDRPGTREGSARATRPTKQPRAAVAAGAVSVRLELVGREDWSLLEDLDRLGIDRAEEVMAVLGDRLEPEDEVAVSGVRGVT